MAAKKSKAKTKKSEPNKEVEATKSEPEVAAAEDSTAAVTSPASTEVPVTEPSRPRKSGDITPSRPIPNAHLQPDSPAAEEAPVAEERLWRHVDVRCPKKGPGQPIMIRVKQYEDGTIEIPERYKAEEDE